MWVPHCVAIPPTARIAGERAFCLTATHHLNPAEGTCTDASTTNTTAPSQERHYAGHRHRRHRYRGRFRLGRGHRSALAQDGVHVYGFDLPNAIENAPSVCGVRYLPVDVTNPHQVQTTVDQLTSGPDPLRTVVNCAGIGPSMRILGKKGPQGLLHG